MKNLVLLLALLCIVSCQSYSQEKIIMDGYLKKNIYLLQEPIDCIISFANISSDVIKEKFERIQIRLRDEKDNLLPYGSRSIGCPSSVSINLEPGKTKFLNFDLVNLFGKTIDSAPLYLYLPVGHYTFEVIASHPQIEPELIKFSFQVVKPDGDEEYVYNSFMQTVSRKHTTDEEIKIVELLYKKFPNSVYTPFLLMNNESLHNLNQNHSKAMEIRKIVVEQYSSSNIALLYLDGVLENMPDNSVRVELLKKILNTNMNEFARKFFEHKIEEWLKK